MAYTREEIEAEIKRRGLKVPQYSRDEIAAEMKRRGLAVPEAKKRPGITPEEAREMLRQAGISIQPQRPSLTRSNLKELRTYQRLAMKS